MTVVINAVGVPATMYVTYKGGALSRHGTIVLCAMVACYATGHLAIPLVAILVEYVPSQLCLSDSHKFTVPPLRPSPVACSSASPRANRATAPILLSPLRSSAPSKSSSLRYPGPSSCPMLKLEPKMSWPSLTPPTSQDVRTSRSRSNRRLIPDGNVGQQSTSRTRFRSRGGHCREHGL
jgi:hypothetical protein